MPDINENSYQYVGELPEETASTFDGSEQFVMFDSNSGKRASLDEVKEYVNEEMGQDLDELNTLLGSFVDGGYVENGVAYFTHGDEVLFEITGVGGGGGGGGGGSNNAILTLSNTTGWLSKTIAYGATCVLSFNWSSLENDIPTGNGQVRVLVGGTVKTNVEIPQGENSINISSYLSSGTNNVKLQIFDVYGNSRTINFTVNTVLFSLTSSFDPYVIYSGPIQFLYTPTGAVSKLMYFVLDGTTIGTQTVTASGRQMTYDIPAQTHGAHTLTVYFDATINSETVRSNVLRYEFMAVEEGEDDVIITSQFNESSVDQYTTINIPYSVYTPNSLTAPVDIYVGETKVQSVTVDRTLQTFSYRANDSGSLTIRLVSGSVSKTIAITVTPVSIDVEAETESLALYLTSNGRSNQEAEPATWVSGDIEAEFSGFNWSSDGWVRDTDGVTVLRVSGDARVTIPYKIFETDFRGTGKTIELEFATRNVLNYESTIISCMSGGRGLMVNAHNASVTSEQTSIGTQYKEDEHVRITFVVEKRTENRLMFIYINGIASGVVQYPTDDDFSQQTPVNITIGSNGCTTDIYCIRVYDNDLTRFQILDNWIADTQNGTEMVERFRRNNIFDDYGNIVIEKLPSDLPYFIQSATELPQYKGDKKTVNGTYTDPSDSSKSFSYSGATSDVQGTSSQYYPRKNYKIKFGGGFIVNGEQVSKYAMNAKAIPVKTFTFKADVASSEGANNVELARLYNDACPYKTPAQLTNQKVRQGIDGFPIVMFWNDGNNVSFLGKYNFNNDKGTEEVFGFAEPDESWEIKNNTSDRVLWKSADYAGDDWLNDFEARYPDTDPPYTDPAQLQEFAEWVGTTDTSKATGNALSSPVTYGTGESAVTYTHDTAAYRLAKFKDEAGDYMELQSALFYYLFTELFLMVDSRAKNAFPSFIGSEVNAND